MRLYYRGPDALITASQFAWLADPPRVFAIADLHGSHLTRRKVGSSWTPAAFLTVLVLGPGYALMNSWLARASLAGVVIVIVTLAVLRSRAGRRWELRSASGGRETVVYSTSDETTFNQVTRALQRVLEQHPEAPSRPGYAVA